MSDRSVKNPLHHSRQTLLAFTRSFGAVLTTLIGSGTMAFKRWWSGSDNSRRSLAALDDDQLSNLSEIGRQIRREERRARSRG